MANPPTLNSIDVGSGTSTPLVMLHGWGHSSREVRSLGELLASHGRIIMIDLPGFGSSEAPPENWGVNEYADCVVRFLNEKGIPKVSLFGHSFGGRISIKIASKYPNLVDKLILCNSAGIPRRRTLIQHLKRLSVVALRRSVRFIDSIFGTKLYEERFIPRFASSDYKSSGVLRKVFVRVVNEDQTDEARKIKKETFLLWGAKDPETPLEIGKRFNRLIQGSKLIVFPLAGHLPFSGGGAHQIAYHLIPILFGDSALTSRRKDAI